MIRLKKIFSMVALGALLITNVIPVSAAERNKPEKAVSLADFELGEYSEYLTNAEAEGTEKQTKAPAPPLTAFELYAIYSPKAGEEIIQHSSSSIQVGSKLDHGGTWFQAITVEVGYARSRFAEFNSNTMTLTDTAALDFNNDRIVDGWLCLWTYEGYEYEAGTFTANSTSSNSPWNTMSMRFNVY